MTSRSQFRTVCLALLLASTALLEAADGSISGLVTDPQGNPVTGASISLTGDHAAKVNQEGRFTFAALPAGVYKLVVTSQGFVDLIRTVWLAEGEALTVKLQFDRLASHKESVNVTADVTELNIVHPDPARRIIVRSDILDANPGRPGAPVSIPGIPIETASGGLKAPQYFAPGVAGDHGEPIASYLQVGSFLVPNNLSANAHGNGYSDPNIMIPSTIESVQVDGGAFNVLEGDHSVNLAVAYGLHSRLEPALALTGDYRDFDVVAGWSPAAPESRAWIAMQASLGNGFLDTPEHRQQYKINGFRVLDLGHHQITFLGIGYFGQSRIPGLVPIDVPDLHDTIDPRQRDQTHTGELALNDVWRLTSASELQLSSFFRTYNLSLYSNFGDGLIRQSEFRTVAGSNATYVRKLSDAFSFMAGLDYSREAPRRLDLDHYESNSPAYRGLFQKITANNVTMNFLAPYVALDGRLTPWLHYSLGWRRDQIEFDSRDLLNPGNSYQKWIGVNSPKATLSLVPPDRLGLPSVSFSFGQTFFTNDPRIGNGTSQGTAVSRAHAFQMVLSKSILHTDFRVTFGRITQEQSLAKIDPDTGLQFDAGPSRNRFATFAASRYFPGGLIQASISKADARDLSNGAPVPEAPRRILDFLATLDRLPFHLHGRVEFENVGPRPLGDGFASVPIREFRGALTRQFGDGRLEAGVNFQIASGYTGQTTEVLALPGENSSFERVVGVYLPSYVSVSFSYRFGRAGRIY